VPESPHCNRPHINDLGQLGVQLAGWALKGIADAEYTNGGLPHLDSDLAALIRNLASNSRCATPVVRLVVPAEGERITLPEAARCLGVSQALVRRWAAQGRIRGSRKAGRDWTFPADAIEDIRRDREAA
jgi:excisionase family DNA binding protein